MACAWVLKRCGQQIAGGVCSAVFERLLGGEATVGTWSNAVVIDVAEIVVLLGYLRFNLRVVWLQ